MPLPTDIQLKTIDGQARTRAEPLADNPPWTSDITPRSRSRQCAPGALRFNEFVRRSRAATPRARSTTTFRFDRTGARGATKPSVERGRNRLWFGGSLDIYRPASEILHRDGSVGRRLSSPMDLREVDFANNRSNLRKMHVGLEIQGVERVSEVESLTDNSAMSRREHAWLDGRFFLGTSLDFDRPRRIRPIHCDGGSDRSRLTRMRG
jgi:hypothetical protein